MTAGWVKSQKASAPQVVICHDFLIGWPVGPLKSMPLLAELSKDYTFMDMRTGLKREREREIYQSIYLIILIDSLTRLFSIYAYPMFTRRPIR